MLNTSFIFVTALELQLFYKKDESIRARTLKTKTKSVVDILHGVFDYCKKVDISFFDCVCDSVKSRCGIEGFGPCGHVCIPCCYVPVLRNVLSFDLNYKTCCTPPFFYLIHVMSKVAAKNSWCSEVLL